MEGEPNEAKLKMSLFLNRGSNFDFKPITTWEQADKKLKTKFEKKVLDDSKLAQDCPPHIVEAVKQGKRLSYVFKASEGPKIIEFNEQNFSRAVRCCAPMDENGVRCLSLWFGRVEEVVELASWQVGDAVQTSARPSLGLDPWLWSFWRWPKIRNFKRMKVSPRCLVMVFAGRSLMLWMDCFDMHLQEYTKKNDDMATRIVFFQQTLGKSPSNICFRWFRFCPCLYRKALKSITLDCSYPWRRLQRHHGFDGMINSTQNSLKQHWGQKWQRHQVHHHQWTGRFGRVMMVMMDHSILQWKCDSHQSDAAFHWHSNENMLLDPKFKETAPTAGRPFSWELFS